MIERATATGQGYRFLGRFGWVACDIEEVLLVSFGGAARQVARIHTFNCDGLWNPAEYVAFEQLSKA